MYILEQAIVPGDFRVVLQCPYTIDVADVSDNHTVLFVESKDDIATIYFYDPSRFFVKDCQFVVDPGASIETYVDSLEDDNAMPAGTPHGDTMRVVILEILRNMKNKGNLFIEFKHHTQYAGITDNQGHQWSHLGSVAHLTGTHRKMSQALAEHFKMHMISGKGFDQFIDAAVADVSRARDETPCGTSNVCFASAALAALYLPTGNEVARTIVHEERVDARTTGDRGLLRIAAEARMKEAMRVISTVECSNSCWNSVIGIIRGLIGKTLRGTEVDTDLSHGQHDPSDVLMRIYELYGARTEVVSSETKSFIAIPGHEIVYKVSDPDSDDAHFMHVELQRGNRRVNEFVYEKIRHNGVVYELVSAIQHIGSTQCGHYIVYVKRNGKWYTHNNLADPLLHPVASKEAMRADINLNGKVFMYFKA